MNQEAMEPNMKDTVDRGYDIPKANSEVQGLVERVDKAIKKNITLVNNLRAKYADVMTNDQTEQSANESEMKHPHIAQSKFGTILENFAVEIEVNNINAQNMLDRAAV